MGILEKIQETEKEIARTQKNKGENVYVTVLEMMLTTYPSLSQLPSTIWVCSKPSSQNTGPS